VLEGSDTFSREPSVIDNVDEGRYVSSELAKSVGSPDKLLALTIGVQFMDTYEPYYNTRYRKVWATNPWVGDNASVDPPASFPITTGIGLGLDRYMMTNGLYVRTQDEIYYASTGGAPPADTGRRYDSVRPVTQVDVEIDGVQESFTELAEYVNRLKGLDGRYFDTEYELQVPYLTAFRRTPDGADSIFNLDLGSTISIDGIDYVAVGREIDFVGLTTKIRLHALTRFSVFAHPTAVAETDIDSGSTDPDDGAEQRRNVESFTAAENITAGWAVAVNDSGQIIKALPVSSQYNRVVGVALTTTAAGSVAQVCTSGVCSVPDTYTVGRALWLRAGSPNMGVERIGAPTTTEHVDQKVGTCVGAGAIEVNIGRPFIWYGWG
jgi:predicted RecA/RadA family phage recombinase